MDMAHLEEQAQMNYLAYCAEGKDYSHPPKRTPRRNVESHTALRASALQKDVLKGRPAQRDGILELS